MKKTFEENFERLDGIVRELSDESYELERRLELYKQGIKLADECEKQLADAQTTVTVIDTKSGGKQ